MGDAPRPERENPAPIANHTLLHSSALYKNMDGSIRVDAKSVNRRWTMDDGISYRPSSIVRIPHSALRTPHSALRIPHSAFPGCTMSLCCAGLLTFSARRLASVRRERGVLRRWACGADVCTVRCGQVCSCWYACVPSLSPLPARL